MKIELNASFLRSVIYALGGRKFLMALVGLAAVYFKGRLGLTSEDVYAAGGLIVTYILGEAHVDNGKASAGQDPEPNPALPAPAESGAK